MLSFHFHVYGCGRSHMHSTTRRHAEPAKWWRRWAVAFPNPYGRPATLTSVVLHPRLCLGIFLAITADISLDSFLVGGLPTSFFDFTNGQQLGPNSSVSCIATEDFSDAWHCISFVKFQLAFSNRSHVETNLATVLPNGLRQAKRLYTCF